MEFDVGIGVSVCWPWWWDCRHKYEVQTGFISDKFFNENYERFTATCSRLKMKMKIFEQIGYTV